MIRKTLIACSLVLGMISQSCDALKDGEGSEVAANFNGEVLYWDDVTIQLPKGLSPADSSAMAQRIVQAWARERVLVNQAEFNLDQRLYDFEVLVEQYRNDLLKHAYIDLYVGKNLDTTVSAAEVEEYYSSHIEDYELKENIVKANYVGVPNEASGMRNARRWFVSTSERYEAKFLEWSELYATVQTSLVDTAWTPFEDFAQQLPVSYTNANTFLARNRTFIVEDTVMTYFVQITDYRIKDSHSPLTYVQDQIKSILLNKRRLELIKEMEESIVEQALKNGTLEIY